LVYPLSYHQFCTVEIHEGPKRNNLQITGLKYKQIILQGGKPEITNVTEG